MNKSIIIIFFPSVSFPQKYGFGRSVAAENLRPRSSRRRLEPYRPSTASARIHRRQWRHVRPQSARGATRASADGRGAASSAATAVTAGILFHGVVVVAFSRPVSSLRFAKPSLFRRQSARIAAPGRLRQLHAVTYSHVATDAVATALPARRRIASSS